MIIYCYGIQAKSLQSCQTHCDPIDCSPSGSSVHGILQARILECVAISSARGSSPLRDGTWVSHTSCIGRWVLYHQHHRGSPFIVPSHCQLTEDAPASTHVSRQIFTRVTSFLHCFSKDSLVPSKV